MIVALVVICLSLCHGFRLSAPRTSITTVQSSSSTRLFGMGKEAKRAWAKGDLSDKDIFESEDDETNMDKKSKMKLEPEVVFYEGPPDKSEVFLPALSVFTIIGIVPFISALSRQAWVRYKFTSRRISIQSGVGGKQQTEIIYPDGMSSCQPVILFLCILCPFVTIISSISLIYVSFFLPLFPLFYLSSVEEIRFVYRAFGAAGDMVLFLKDGAKVELRHVPKFEDIYSFVLSKCDADCVTKSMKLAPKKDAATA